MDIWRWVIESANQLRKDGDQRLAWLIYAVPDRVSDLKHEEADGLVTEAVALARAAKNPWLELYFRHWHMQSRVIHRHEVKDCLPEAVSLLDFASRPDTHTCPQAVCVVQDLACTYADTDGPGYVEERLAVARETLDRIDASWPCWDCISSEYGSALLDADRGAELLDFVDRQIRAIHQRGATVGHNLHAQRARALLLLHRPQEALEVALHIDGKDPSHTTTLKRDHLLARCYLALGRLDEARDRIPHLDRVRDSPGYYDDWSEVVLEAVLADVLPLNSGIITAFVHMGRRLHRNGSLFKRAVLWQRAARLLLHAQTAHAARLLLDRVDAAIPELRAPQTLQAAQQPLRDALAHIPPHPPTPDPEAPITDPAPELDAALRALDAAPDHPALLRRAAACLANLGLIEEAADLLADPLLRGVEDPSLLAFLGRILLDDGAGDLLDAHLDRLQRSGGDAIASEAVRLRARRLEQAGRYAEALQALAPLLTPDPLDLHPAVAYQAAVLERQIGRPERALALLLPHLPHVEPGPLEWEIAIAGTLTGAWDAVRHAAERLGMTFDGDGPIDEPSHRCRVVLDDAPGKPLRAVRTGPATVRVTQFTAPDQPRGERFRDLLLIDPTPLHIPADDAPPEDITFRALTTLTPGAWRTWTLDGIRPGPRLLQALARAVEGLGGLFNDVSHPDYTITPVGARKSRPGLYVYMAVPASVTPDDLHRALTDATRGKKHQLCWSPLAEAAGDRDAIELHVATAIQLNL